MATVTHKKTLTVPDWSQGDLDTVIAGGAAPTPPPGTLIAGVALSSDWNDTHDVSDIANADIAAAAAIAVSKLAALTASRAVVTDGSGVLTPATTTSTEIGYVNGVTSAIQTQLDTKITASSTNTLTNKRITARTDTVASSATPTINTDNVDYFSITALAAAITSFTTNLSGTPTTAQKLWISITDNGTARGLTWGASFEASTQALPTTTVINTRLDVGFVWNEATSKWRCVSVA